MAQYKGEGWVGRRSPTDRQSDDYSTPFPAEFSKWTQQRRTGPPEPPIPEWLEEYILELELEQKPPHLTPARMMWEREKMVGQYPEVSRYLQPLGAQEELNPRELEHMAAFLEWRMGGSPDDPNIPSGMREVGRGIGPTSGGGTFQSYWDEYVRLSQALFPKQVNLRPGWATARQR